MDDDITKLIREYGAENVVGYRLDYNGKQYAIRDKYVPDFWRKYCQLIQDKANKRFCLSEVGDNHAPPLSIEGTVRFSKDYDGSEIITTEFILNIIGVYQEIIGEHFEVDDDGMEVRCVYLETDEYKIGDQKCSSFRIQFPWCQVDPSFHKKTIHPTVVSRLRKNKAFSALLEEPESNWEEVLNADYIGQPLPLYGASRSADIPPLSFRAIYGKQDSDSDSNDLLELDDVFNPKKHEHYKRKLISKSLFEEENYRFFLPLFLSVFYYLKPLHIFGDQDEAGDDNSSIGEDDFDTEDISHDLGLARDFHVPY